MGPFQVTPPHWPYADCTPPAMLDEGTEDEAARELDGAGELIGIRVEGVTLATGVEEAMGVLLELPAPGTRTATVDMVGTAALFLTCAVDDAELEAGAEPEPAVAEPVEVTSEVVCEIDVAPEYIVGPGTW